MMGECEFLERSRRSGEIIEICNLNGRVCLVTTGQWGNCTRRTWALENPPKPEAPKSPE